MEKVLRCALLAALALLSCACSLFRRPVEELPIIASAQPPQPGYSEDYGNEKKLNINVREEECKAHEAWAREDAAAAAASRATVPVASAPPVFHSAFTRIYHPIEPAHPQHQAAAMPSVRHEPPKQVRRIVIVGHPVAKAAAPTPEQRYVSKLLEQLAAEQQAHARDRDAWQRERSADHRELTRLHRILDALAVATPPPDLAAKEPRAQKPKARWWQRTGHAIAAWRIWPYLALVLAIGIIVGVARFLFSPARPQSRWGRRGLLFDREKVRAGPDPEPGPRPPRFMQ